MMDLNKIIFDFCNSRIKNLEIYNEFSLQHELGIFLRTELHKDYKVEFERNTNYFGIKEKLIKKEIDIVVYNKEEKYAIELKSPNNGQYPEEMYSFIKDIKFLEQLKKNNFTQTFFIALVFDHNFYSGKKTTGIYQYFRTKDVPITGIISKPTGNNNDISKIEIEGKYNIDWVKIKDIDKNNIEKYFLLDM